MIWSKEGFAEFGLTSMTETQARSEPGTGCPTGCWRVVPNFTNSTVSGIWGVLKIQGFLTWDWTDSNNYFSFSKILLSQQEFCNFSTRKVRAFFSYLSNLIQGCAFFGWTPWVVLIIQSGWAGLSTGWTETSNCCITLNESGLVQYWFEILLPYWSV